MGSDFEIQISGEKLFGAQHFTHKRQKKEAAHHRPLFKIIPGKLFRGGGGAVSGLFGLLPALVMALMLFAGLGGGRLARLGLVAARGSLSTSGAACLGKCQSSAHDQRARDCE
jgi:hypothetical protein